MKRAARHSNASLLSLIIFAALVVAVSSPAAAFIVYHDHTGNFQQYCQGTFFVTKTGVSFKADNGVDTFETADSNIKEAKTNGWVGSEFGAFHIKPVQQINGHNNFNFAPNTRNKAEAQMIIRLVSAY